MNLNEADRENFEERAAIVEEANPGMSRAEAEAFALQCVLIARQFDALDKPMQVQTGQDPRLDPERDPWPARAAL